MKQLVVLALGAALVWTFLKVFPNDSEGQVEAGGSSFDPRPAESVEPPLEPRSGPPASGGPQVLGMDDSGGDGEASEPAGSSLFTAAAKADGNNPFAAPVNAVATAWSSSLRQNLAAALAYERNDRAYRDARDGRASLPEGVGETVMAFVDAIEGREAKARELAGRLDVEGRITPHAKQVLLATLGIVGEAPDIALEELGGLSPEELGMQFAWWREAARLAEEQGRYADAAAYWSRLTLGVLDTRLAFEPRVFEEWMEELRALQEKHRWNPNGGWPGFELKVQPGESLIAVRKRALAQDEDLVLCTGLIQQANDRKSDILHEGETLRIPTDPVHVMVDLSSRWMLYFHGDEVVDGWQVGIGRPGEETITGDFWVGNKQKEPTHFPRGQQPVPFGTKDNPLGTRWMGWRMDPEASKDSPYGFHGTWEDESIGQALGEGCVRMFNDRAEFLFEVLPQQTPIHVRD